MLGITIEKPEPKYTKVSAVLPVGMAKFLKEKSSQQNVSMSKILKRALQDYFLGEI